MIFSDVGTELKNGIWQLTFVKKQDDPHLSPSYGTLRNNGSKATF